MMEGREMKKMTFEAFVRRVLDDPELYKNLKKSPEKTLKSLGVKTTRKQLDALKAFNWDHVEDLHGAFDPSIQVLN
jgi:hypothetical protein